MTKTRTTTTLLARLKRRARITNDGHNGLVASARAAPCTAPAPCFVLECAAAHLWILTGFLQRLSDGCFGVDAEFGVF